MDKSNNYVNPYGLWKVETEGDCEGRSVRQLGIYEGYIDEIAFGLADKCYYSLQFTYLSKDDINQKFVPKKDSVNINLNIESKTWDLKPDERVKWFENFLIGRDVIVSRGSSYAAVTISNRKTNDDIVRQTALDKLTKEEKEVLGIRE